MSLHRDEGATMKDVTVKRIDQMDSLFDGMFVRARAELGVRAFGMQVLNLPAGWQNYPEHSHAGSPYEVANDGQEEVYLVLSGSATLITGEERYALEPGVMVRVGPAQSRKIVTGDEPAQVLAIGATPGLPYSPAPFTEVGAPPPPAPS